MGHNAANGTFKWVTTLPISERTEVWRRKRSASHCLHRALCLGPRWPAAPLEGQAVRASVTASATKRCRFTQARKRAANEQSTNDASAVAVREVITCFSISHAVANHSLFILLPKQAA